MTAVETRAGTAVATAWAVMASDLRCRSRRPSFLVTAVLVVCLAQAVVSGEVLIALDGYRGRYTSAWTGTLVAVVATVLLGALGMPLVKGAIERDRRSGVGQVLVAGPFHRLAYVVGRWAADVAHLLGYVAVLAVAALVLQLRSPEARTVQPWAVVEPLLLLAVPMMAFVAAVAVLLESLPALGGGRGTQVWFGLYLTLFLLAVFVPGAPDVTGITTVSASMREAAQHLPGYDGGFTLSMASRQDLVPFDYPGIAWTLPMVLGRLGWLAASVALVLLAYVLVRVDGATAAAARGVASGVTGRSGRRGRRALPEVPAPRPADGVTATALGGAGSVHVRRGPRVAAVPRLVGYELRLLARRSGRLSRAVVVLLWTATALAPTAALRDACFAVASLWPVLLLAGLGHRDVSNRTEELVRASTDRPLLADLAAWAAGVVLLAAVTSGVLVGRLLDGEPSRLPAFAAFVVTVPALALALGAWSRSGLAFEVVYPVWWFIGPFNRDSGLAAIDFLGLHDGALVLTAPLAVAGTGLALLGVALAARRRPPSRR